MRIHKIILCLFVIGLGVSSAFAAGSEITLYPSGAVVQKKIKIHQQNGIIKFLLPPGMVEDSLRVNVAGAEVRGMEFQPAGQDNMAQALRPSMDRFLKTKQDWHNAQKRVQELQNALTSLNARLELWLKPPVPGLAQVGDLHKVETSMMERTAALMVERSAVQAELAAAELVAQRLAESIQAMLPESEMNPVPGQRYRPVPNPLPNPMVAPAAEPGLAIPDLDDQGLAGNMAVVRLVPHKDNLPLPAEIEAVLSYRLNNCGWTPRYVIEALTAEKSVLVRREAVINQRTGEDWQGVRLSLSTLPPSANAPLVNLRPWLVRQIGPAIQAKARMANTPAKATLESDSVNLMQSAPPATSPIPAQPLRNEEVASAMWVLGEFTVLSGQPQQITLDSQHWKAEYYRLLRPAASKFSWIMASVTPDAPQVFEEAEADFYVDARHVGRNSFSFSGSRGDLSFGQDIAVTATMEADSKQSGESGFLAKSRTQAWSWTIKARNAHTFPVEVWVEDAAPQAGDERIELRVESQPKPVREGNTLRWKLPLKPGTENVIRHKVSYAAPDNMQVNPGR